MYYLVKVSSDPLSLVDIVEDQLFPFLELKSAEESVGTAPTPILARKLAKENGLIVRQVIHCPRDISEKLAVYLINIAEESGIDRNRAIAALLPMMSEEAKRRHVS